MEEYLQQGPPAYKRARPGDSLQISTNFSDARSNMVPFGFIATQDRETDINMTSMSMTGNLALNPIQDFGQLSTPDWRHAIPPDSRNRFVHKISQALIHNTRNGENSDNRSRKWIAAARKIEGKAFKTATSRAQYFNLVKEEIHKIQMGYGFPSMSSQFLPSSSTTSAAATNNIQLVNMQQNYGPNNFGEPAVTATQSHNQSGITHSVTSVNLFSEEAVGGTMRIPISSSIGSARPQFEAFNSRQPGPRPMVHDQVHGSSIPIGDSTQFMPNAEQVLAPNILHPMNALMATPLSQFMPSPAVSSQQRFGLNDSAQGVLSENSSIINSQIPGRLQSKEWHKSVTFNVRNRLIRKMAQILSTTPDPQAGSLENRMHNCISIATSVENETYRTANSMTQYYDLMAKRCHFIAKERANPTQAGIQYYNLSDIRRTYEALGIAYPMGPSPFPGNGGGGGIGGSGGGGSTGSNGGVSSGAGTGTAGNMRLHVNDVPPPPGVLPNLMGSASGTSLPYCPVFTRGQATAIQQANHNQLLGTNNNRMSSTVPMSLDEVPDVIKQLAHAYKCQERENQENDVMLLCSLPHCRETKNLLNHITTCPVGISCCGSTKEIIDHWNRCVVSDCPICLPLRQAERNLTTNVVSTTSLNNQMNVNPVFMRRPHRGMGSNYPSTATSGLLSNQSQNGPSGLNGPNNGIGGSGGGGGGGGGGSGGGGGNSGNNSNGSVGGSGGNGRNDRISPRSSMWHSNYNDSLNWRSSGNQSSDMSMDGGTGRRSQPRFWLHNRNNANRHERRAPYNSPWAAPEIIFVDNMRNSGQPPRGTSLFGPVGSNRNIDRLQPYGTPWRSPDILFVENVRPAHRQTQMNNAGFDSQRLIYSDEPVIIPPEEDATPTEHQQMMAIVKVVKTHGGRLEQKFRCARRSCSASWPCLHRRLAASIHSHKTPIPG